jgi:hypothetical protein
LTKIEQGELGEKIALKEIKKLHKFDRSGASLHYGRQGLDLYATRNTPKGMTLYRFEVKSSNNYRAGRSGNAVLSLLKTGRKDSLQQGSKLYGEDRLNRALKYNCKTASYIRSKQVMAGVGRCWQARDYICFVNTATNSVTFWRPVQNKQRNRVIRLEQVKL